MILSTGPEEDFISAIWPTLRYNAKNKASFGFFSLAIKGFALWGTRHPSYMCQQKAGRDRLLGSRRRTTQDLGRIVVLNDTCLSNNQTVGPHTRDESAGMQTHPYFSG